MASPRGWFDPPEPEAEESGGRAAFAPRRLDGPAWLALGIGGGLAALCLAVPKLRFALSYLTVLIHELGHAIVGWLFGYPSIPAFDFAYGGGITTAQGRSRLLLGVAYALFAGLIVLYRRNRLTLLVLLAGLGAFALLAHTGYHRALILFMGHGTELVIAGIFLYRALSGATVAHAAERPLYAACGLFIVLSDIAFAHQLWANPGARALYGEAKGGGHWMDFSQIAEGYLWVGLPTVAFFFLLCCLATVAVSFLAHRYHERVFAFLARLVQRTPD